jgi:CheY-like chemotaxis protein
MTRKRILIVDDDAEIRALCARWLGKVTRSL